MPASCIFFYCTSLLFLHWSHTSERPCPRSSLGPSWSVSSFWALFLLFMEKIWKSQKLNLDQQTACRAPVCWSKYTTNAKKWLLLVKIHNKDSYHIIFDSLTKPPVFITSQNSQIWHFVVVVKVCCSLLDSLGLNLPSVLARTVLPEFRFWFWLCCLKNLKEDFRIKIPNSDAMLFIKKMLKLKNDRISMSCDLWSPMRLVKWTFKRESKSESDSESEL